MTLIVKIMSAEDLADDSTQKSFKLITGVEHVEFHRRSGAPVARMTVAGEDEAFEIDLDGNVYVMNQNGKTVASFGVAPPRPPENVPTLRRIEAVYWNGATLGFTDKPGSQADARLHMPDWMPACAETLPTEALTRAATKPGEVRRFDDILYIGTPRGVEAALPGYWIFKGPDGLYPAHKELFEWVISHLEADPDVSPSNEDGTKEWLRRRNEQTK